MPSLVLASGNAGKLAEFSQLLLPLGLTICSQSEFGVSGAEETGLTFVENALLKARHASRQTGLPAIADDSGLAVDALSGAPGIYSARYAGPDSTDTDNNTRLLQALEDVPSGHRQARYWCVLVYLTHADDPVPLIVQRDWQGEILTSPRGAGGFGYDPLFYLPDHRCTAAELSKEDKNHNSHRGRAVRDLIGLLSRT
ncbi:RdgB/HAM1 family non-canonical purine NTP pyrophosphatase [Larsenimonas rhizosphaerae]|uniref:dITP/XTP pyrophosphatase n=1 Tax=Larsenimonas rhizosphaerae TaxID=2944682 RepID=A0AA42CUF2_9GAMM|nr:RdgB/HAM1 family non-canonical purine NTP pyrophosphatase [Larsenimonas rhizosphaerae]MCX2523941.1 RdgB/HAM1 family non-canonical purine NTP pyrophosphatase [Larsenimonas rhizosphaerae]